MSTHKAEVVVIDHIEKHPNADSLEIVRIGGYQVVVKINDYKVGDLAVYVEPDSIVQTDMPEFSFLKRPERSQERIKVKKLRGIYSQGLLLKGPEGAKVGDDCWNKLSLSHYEPPEPMTTGGDNEPAPPGHYPVYDVENFNKYPRVILSGEEVWITEKLHGCNARYTFKNGRMYCGSRTNLKKEDEKSVWWKALRQNPWIETFLIGNPNLTLYGEVFGQVQNLKYGSANNQFFFKCFDIWTGNNWMDSRDLPSILTADELVPTLFVGPFNETIARELAEGDSSIASHHREGVVVKPMINRFDMSVGRVILKIVGNRYLSKD